ncbi:MAG: mannose-6-phosphate isomerase, class I [Flavisolibacter sp.]
MKDSERVFKLNGVVQNYSWGGFSFIPDLLGIKNEEEKPFAEYWLGAHANHSARIEEEKLSDLIEKKPLRYLGAYTQNKFSGLPYLLKILDVRQMLSIQVHPSIASAQQGFEEENQKGIPLKAPNRNYKDANHKPEMMIALDDFWLLHGFKNERALGKALKSAPELNFLKDLFQNLGYQSLYEAVMHMEQDRVNEILQPLSLRVLPLYRNGQLEKNDPDFWAARAIESFCSNGQFDRGIFSIYFFNLVHLKKGQGVFQPAGMPHAYLEGQNVELMSNSDNVLRAGLTEKYIDVPELMKHVQFEATEPRILEPMKQGEDFIFPTPAVEFELHQQILKEGKKNKITIITPAIFLLLEGSLELCDEVKTMRLEKGESVYVLPGTSILMKALLPVNLFYACVPQN